MVGMRRRDFITLLGGATAWPLTAHAQAPKNIPRLCFLTFDPGTLQSNRFDAFFQGLRDLGYANGQNIVIDYLSAEGNGERFPVCRSAAETRAAGRFPRCRGKWPQARCTRVFGEPAGRGPAPTKVSRGTDDEPAKSAKISSNVTLFRYPVPQAARNGRNFHLCT